MHRSGIRCQGQSTRFVGTMAWVAGGPGAVEARSRPGGALIGFGATTGSEALG